MGGDAGGALYRAEKNQYDPFGKEESGAAQPQSSILNEVKYTGAVEDASGLYYLGSRHYDPNTGRFIQQDTFRGELYSPWTQNRYAYTSNNPVNYTDPSGHFLGMLIGGLIGGISGFFNGDGFWKGAASGAVVDFAVATGGWGGVAIAAVGGTAIEGYSEYDRQKLQGGAIDGWKIEENVGEKVYILSHGKRISYNSYDFCGSSIADGNKNWS